MLWRERAYSQIMLQFVKDSPSLGARVFQVGLDQNEGDSERGDYGQNSEEWGRVPPLAKSMKT